MVVLASMIVYRTSLILTTSSTWILDVKIPLLRIATGIMLLRKANQERT